MNTAFLRKKAVEAARAAGAISAHWFKKGVREHITEKQGAGIVTHVDILCEKKIRHILKPTLKEFDFLGEETASETDGRSKPGRWHVDPLDGTTNFAHGFPMFCVSIGAEWEGDIVVGVIFNPVTKQLYVAEKGKGATLNGKKIHVSSTTKLTEALLSTGLSYQKDQYLHAEIQTFEKLAYVARGIRRPGSAALDLALTASGVFDAFWERALNTWDVAAGILLVEEAGGRVSDFKGRPYKIGCVELMASNSRVHDEILSTL